MHAYVYQKTEAGYTRPPVPRTNSVAIHEYTCGGQGVQIHALFTRALDGEWVVSFME